LRDRITRVRVEARWTPGARWRPETPHQVDGGGPLSDCHAAGRESAADDDEEDQGHQGLLGHLLERSGQVLPGLLPLFRVTFGFGDFLVQAGCRLGRDDGKLAGREAGFEREEGRFQSMSMECIHDFGRRARAVQRIAEVVRTVQYVLVLGECRP